MAYSALAVANAFIERFQRGELKELSPMKLQKLLFYVQSWYLRDHNGQPLIDDFFARWTHGPVIPSLYHDFKQYGAGNIATQGFHVTPVFRPDGTAGWETTTPNIPEFDGEAQRYINEIIRVYGDYSGWQLSWMTHQPGTAWARGTPDGGVISWSDMAQYIHPQDAPVANT